MRTSGLPSSHRQSCRVPGGQWPHLVTPTAYEGRALLDEAREALAVIVQHINDDAGPIVAKVVEERRAL
ncbi:hypothetical protein ABT255_02400 [Streptomyces mirabilis]|uniref:hypothetical protein n=1 Tax=Streptomyces mirabilis TaxID=68239 RepID=UPI00331728E7